MSADPGSSASSQSKIWVAPGGYGKSRALQQALAQLPADRLVLDGSCLVAEPGEYFRELGQQCQKLGISQDFSQPRRWLRQLPPLTLVMDNWQELEALPELKAFWQEALEADSGLQLLLASRKTPDLPLLASFAQAGAYLDRSQLSWSLSAAQAQWQAAAQVWDAGAERFWQSVEGWPLALLLYLRRVQGELSSLSFESLLLQAIKQWFPGFIKDFGELWLAEHQAALAQWQTDFKHWLPLFKQKLQPFARQQPVYWVFEATRPDVPPLQARVFLERALSLCRPEQVAKRLNVLTRLAHIASLLGDATLLDTCLSQGSPLLTEGRLVDQAAWYYLQANRARQCCHYAQAHQVLDSLLALPAHSPAVLNFQVRARLLRGLTAYQQGDYALTRQSYTEALYLAQADQNQAMQLELKIMLAFLDALLGLAEEPLADNIQAEVEALPLSSQPLVWLNLAFVQLLGEHLDLEAGQHILAKGRLCAEKLSWPFLGPMIADVEARLWRFHQDFERAERLHHQALSQLEPQTFDWLYASLNHALTLLRRKQYEAARPLLETICQKASENGSLGVLHEAQAALQVIAPAIKAELRHKPDNPIALGGAQARLEIRCFGSFQLSLDGQPIERWPRKRARHLLLHLLLNPHGLHRETLADWLTGSDALEASLRSLDVHIHALRKLLEPERKGKQTSHYIQFHDAVYAFNWKCHYSWDAEEFSLHYQHWLRLRELEPEAAAEQAAQALGLYTGPFLPELDFADEWLAERESYARKASDLALWRLEQFSRQGRFEEAEDQAEQLLKWDSLSESGFSWLLRLAGQIQDRSRLERLGERMEQTFEKELACPPPKALLQLYHQQLQALENS